MLNVGSELVVGDGLAILNGSRGRASRLGELHAEAHAPELCSGHTFGRGLKDLGLTCIRVRLYNVFDNRDGLCLAGLSTVVIVTSAVVSIEVDDACVLGCVPVASIEPSPEQDEDDKPVMMRRATATLLRT